MLPDMVNFVIQNYYPDIWAAHGGEGSSLTQRQDMYLAFFRWGGGGGVCVWCCCCCGDVYGGGGLWCSAGHAPCDLQVGVDGVVGGGGVMCAAVGALLLCCTGS